MGANKRDAKHRKRSGLTWKKALSAPVNPDGLKGKALKEWNDFVQEQEALHSEELPPPPDKCEPILTQSAYEDVLLAYPLVAEPKEDELPWSHTPAGNLLARRAAQEMARRIHENIDTWDGPPTTADQVQVRIEQLSSWINSVMEAIGYDADGRSGGGLLSLFAIQTPSAEFFSSFDPRPPADVLPMLFWPSAFVGPADFLGSIPPSISDGEKAERIWRNLRVASDWMAIIEDPKNLDVQDWLEVEAKLTNLWMSMRVFALRIKSWVDNACAAFEDCTIPRVTVFREDKRHVQVTNADDVEMVRLTPKLGDEFWLLAKGRPVEPLNSRKKALAEKIPSIKRFILDAPEARKGPRLDNRITIRLHPDLLARISTKAHVPS